MQWLNFLCDKIKCVTRIGNHGPHGNTRIEGVFNIKHNYVTPWNESNNVFLVIIINTFCDQRTFVHYRRLHKSTQISLHQSVLVATSRIS